MPAMIELNTNSICARVRCRHSLDTHDPLGCWADILTVLDTPGRCECVGFTTDPEDSYRNLLDMRGRIELCDLCCLPLRDEKSVHAACAQAADPDQGKWCSRCGGDPYTCPCTTGWSSTEGMRW